MSKADDFLIEVGTEELPPKALRSLMEAFGRGLAAAIDEAPLARGDVHSYASPRRLAVLVNDLARRQDARKVEQKGPPLSVAFDKDGGPTPAALAFAKKCGVAVADLERAKTDKGEWLVFDAVKKGKTAAELMPALIERTLASLPIPRRMRWGAGDTEFVRPVHWIVMLHGKDVIDASVLETAAGNTSRGHRFLSSGAITITQPKSYLSTLEKKGHVIADFNRRRDMVRDGVNAAAIDAGGHVVNGESLYDEVAALVEWPVPLIGRFDEQFLALPREAVISTLSGHQRYFPIADDDGALLPRFITVANLESKDPDQVREGNERVIRPRLADAAFFWDSDRRKTLASREDVLREVIYQRGLGSLYDKSRRNRALATWLASKLNVDKAHVERAAALAKCDLLTGMVGEFPELQGTMGRHYALSDGEPGVVADAIGEHYQPRFAGDDLPLTETGQILAVADKLDTLAGVFSIGKKPTGNRDPFGLRRAALGVVRIFIEGGLDIDLKALLAKAVDGQPKGKFESDALVAELYAFITDRLRRYFLDRDAGLATETFDAVMVREPASLVDFDRRLAAVQTFARLEQAESLSAANKRIANILRKAGDPQGFTIKKKLLQHEAEQALFNALDNARQKVRPMVEARSYAEALNELADLRGPVDRFFDDVMVMADDDDLKNNRLALLGELRALFLDVADISRLSLA
ncbi:MAG: glycine--tRNA ligase subunit beta [Gammaproteobacteria bacterium]|nr:glycine--tRNA ligase subunit beta [Gammaproteobacteria bacterium]